MFLQARHFPQSCIRHSLHTPHLVFIPSSDEDASLLKPRTDFLSSFFICFWKNVSNTYLEKETDSHNKLHIESIDFDLPSYLTRGVVVALENFFAVEVSLGM